MDLVGGLRGFGLDQYEANFRDNKVDGMLHITSVESSVLRHALIRSALFGAAQADPAPTRKRRKRPHLGVELSMI
jgi:hypothetical protein